MQQKAHLTLPPGALPAYLEHIPALAAQLGDFGAFTGNAVELLPDYAGSIARLVADIDAATDHVHLLTYILAPDETGESVAAALTRAVRRGVQCRLMADAVGSRPGLEKLGPQLRRDGVEVIAMLAVGFFRHNAARFDLRNHRKLAVIDGSIGYAGSQNLVNPAFVPGHPSEELVARITGPVVAQIQAILLADRFIETGATFDYGPLFPELPATGASAAQLLPSGPVTSGRMAQELFARHALRGPSACGLSLRPTSVPDGTFRRASVWRHGVEWKCGSSFPSTPTRPSRSSHSAPTTSDLLSARELFDVHSSIAPAFFMRNT